MNNITEEYNKYQKKYRLVIYINKNFEWKEQLIEFCNKYDDLVIIKENEVVDLYSLYDFSNKLIIMSDNIQFGSIWNLVRQDIISLDEAFEALLLKCNA